jgi:hypothetical protein
MNLEFVEWMWSASSVDHLRCVQAERGLSDDEFFRQLMGCRVANLRRLEEVHARGGVPVLLRQTETT